MIPVWLKTQGMRNHNHEVLSVIRRFSSRRQRLDQSFLTDRLVNAQAYDRIAGYFSSSILEVSGEALETMSGLIRVVCNSDLHVRDVETARAASHAMRREWCASQPEQYHGNTKDRFARLYEFLCSGKMQVRVLPRDKFGLVHGKAGVITLVGGGKTCFIGSTNETHDAWKMNYELVWEDDAPDAVQWVQEEFDALWNSLFAVSLADFVIEDVGRLARRTVVPSVEVWRDDPEPAIPIVETPVYRQEYGLWEHQKYFVKLAFDAHRGPHGARFVLADMVGLGKTLQLAMAGMLMALYGTRPVLILVPKTLLWQWQDEMRNLLDMPSAVWTGNYWVDENGVEHPTSGPEGIKACPRRVGLVSQGLITSKSEAVDYLRHLSYECIIVDEAHRARRKNLGPQRQNEKPDPNNLLAFLYDIAPRTRSLLLATATPVQLYPVEAWDLLNILATGCDYVLGNPWSNWRRAAQALDLIMRRHALPQDDLELWGWVRNPLPPDSEGRDFELIRRSLHLSDEDAVASGSAWLDLKEPDRARVRRVARDFAQQHNPFIRRIIRRTREFLENTLDPETGEPYLKPVHVELLGESDKEAIRLPPYLWDAYALAEEFCQLLATRLGGSGFLKTLLLRRVGSTIYAGRKTAEDMLSPWQDIGEAEDEELEEETFTSLTLDERTKIQAFIDALEANQERDPKYEVVVDILLRQRWLYEGCIIFSQYFDSVWWLANQLSRDLPKETIGIYAGGQRSGLIVQGVFTSKTRDELKHMVWRDEIRLLLGTDAASEGLNLQRLGTLINLDLPWNPTRLEQRKGRIQRIGQLRDKVLIYNMRYKGSVEDRVHELLSKRFQGIYTLFGQLPDVLEDVWVEVALGRIERAKATIDAVPKQHPFEIRYQAITKVPWESCSKVLDASDRKEHLLRGWKEAL
jgi:superfamily II DNA or RNA helicase